MIKKIRLALVVFNILHHTCTVGIKHKDSDVSTPVIIKAVLAHSYTSEFAISQYALFDDHYWNHVRVCQPISV